MKRAEQTALEGGCDRLGVTTCSFKGKPQGGSNSFPGARVRGEVRAGLPCGALVSTGLSGA